MWRMANELTWGQTPNSNPLSSSIKSSLCSGFASSSPSWSSIPSLTASDRSKKFIISSDGVKSHDVSSDEFEASLCKKSSQQLRDGNDFSLYSWWVRMRKVFQLPLLTMVGWVFSIRNVQVSCSQRSLIGLLRSRTFWQQILSFALIPHPFLRTPIMQLSSSSHLNHAVGSKCSQNELLRSWDRRWNFDRRPSRDLKCPIFRIWNLGSSSSPVFLGMRPE